MLYDKSILRLLETCKNVLCSNKEKSIILIYSENKKELQRLCCALCEIVAHGYYVSRDELSQMMIEAMKDETQRVVINDSKDNPLLFLNDFELIAGKKIIQNIAYDILYQRVNKNKKTIIFSEMDVFAGEMFSNRIQDLLCESYKFEL